MQAQELIEIIKDYSDYEVIIPAGTYHYDIKLTEEEIEMVEHMKTIFLIS